MRVSRTACVTALLSASAIAVTAGCSNGQSPAASQAPSSGVATQTGSIQQNYVDVVQAVLPSVVQITTTAGLGSGIVLDNQGNIVTNAHVVGSATEFKVNLSTGGNALSAKLVYSYPVGDLAVIKLDNAPSDLRPAKFADSSKLQVGQVVMAMGNPLGLSSSVTEGIVSGLSRTVSEPKNAESPGTTLTDTVQTSAAINPGNSGGALVDLNGQVVGIPTLAATDPQLGGGAAPGIGFAISSNTASDIAGQIVKNGKVTDTHRAALGITGRTVVSSDGKPAGVGVISVTSGGPADQAGIKPGDVIVSVNDTAVNTLGDLSQALATLKPGDQAKVGLVKADGGKATVTVTLGELGK